MAKDCSVLAGEMEQSWETWGQDLFLPGPQTSPEPEVPSFQGLEVTGEILWCLLGAFAPGDPSKGTVPRTCQPPSIRTWKGRSKKTPCSWDTSFSSASSLGYWGRISVWGCQSKLAPCH